MVRRADRRDPAGHRRLTASTLRAAVDRVANSPEVAARLAEVQAETRANGGITRAADAVESFLK